MKKRQFNKILKRAGLKLHKEIELSSLEKRTCNKSADSKLTIALNKFHTNEFDAGTIYETGYIDRLKNVYKVTLTIENVTGVKKITA